MTESGSAPSPSALAARRELLRHIRDVPDFPAAGVVFRDLSPLFAAPAAWRVVVDEVVAQVHHLGGTAIAGVEARGFVVGAAAAAAAGLPFVPVRKAGKLPPPTVAADYVLEYGTARVELPDPALPVSHVGPVVVVDDVLATGGTLQAACGLVERAGHVVAGAVVLLELQALGGVDLLVDRRVRALVTV